MTKCLQISAGFHFWSWGGVSLWWCTHTLPGYSGASEEKEWTSPPTAQLQKEKNRFVYSPLSCWTVYRGVKNNVVDFPNLFENIIIQENGDKSSLPRETRQKNIMFSSMRSAHPMQQILNNNLSIVSFQTPFWLSSPKLKEIQQVTSPVLSPAQCIIITFILPRCERASSIKHLGLRRDTKDYFEAHKWGDNHGRIRSKQNRACNRRSRCFRSCVMLK